MNNTKVKVTDFFSISSDRQAFKIYKVSSFADIWECKETSAKSLHATKQFFPGEVIARIEINGYVDKPNYLSVQIDKNQHIMLAPEYLQYINHSCEPNVFFDTTNMVVTCLKKIDVGEAMTFFYPSTEWSMAQQFDCLCGSEKCLGKIQGAAHLPLSVLKNYSLNEHLKKQAYQAIGN